MLTGRRLPEPGRLFAACPATSEIASFSCSRPQRARDPARPRRRVHREAAGNDRGRPPAGGRGAARSPRRLARLVPKARGRRSGGTRTCLSRPTTGSRSEAGTVAAGRRCGDRVCEVAVRGGRRPDRRSRSLRRRHGADRVSGPEAGPAGGRRGGRRSADLRRPRSTFLTRASGSGCPTPAVLFAAAQVLSGWPEARSVGGFVGVGSPGRVLSSPPARTSARSQLRGARGVRAARHLLLRPPAARALVRLVAASSVHRRSASA
jgi:hypothetical protein